MLSGLRAAALLLATVSVGGKSGFLTPREILERAEFIRNPDGAYGFHLRITTSYPGRETLVSTFLVHADGRMKTLAQQISPQGFAGRRVLMLDREAWWYLPGSEGPLRTHLQSVVTGEVASADIARVDLSRLYEAKLLREEPIDETPCYLLELTTGAAGINYTRILYWVSKRHFRPMKAEYYAASGRLMKTGRFGDYRLSLGEMRPGRLVLEDAGDRPFRSEMEFREFRKERLPESWFVPDALAGLVLPSASADR